MTIECHGLDTETQVCFYEQEFYPLSNFSAFTMQWKGLRFDTSEAVYHWEKFDGQPSVQHQIIHAPSAHEAFRIAQEHKRFSRIDWNDVKCDVMLDIIRTKAAQHGYVRKKLFDSGDRHLVENSWRDDFWGWGPSRDGKNMLGELWMRVRSEMRSVLDQP